MGSYLRYFPSYSKKFVRAHNNIPIRPSMLPHYLFSWWAIKAEIMPDYNHGLSREIKCAYIPTQAPYYFFFRFPKMLQGGHLLSWYHEILHAFLSSFESAILPNTSLTMNRRSFLLYTREQLRI